MTAPITTTPGAVLPDGGAGGSDGGSSSPLPPAVVAVVVAHGAGTDLEGTLVALARQEYSNLTVLVVDAGSAEPLGALVGAVLPEARVHRLESNPGFAAAADTAREVVDGAAFFLFCHDDVQPDPDVVSLLVAEAFRSNAGIVGPKLVDIAEPRLLRSVGYSVDRTGAVVPVVDHGELDQAQHDAVRDVFGVSDACVLVRADLFAELEGFDEGIPYYGADVDLCWRAQIAGARVIVAPAARVRHREGLEERRPDLPRRRLTLRHAIRTRRGVTRRAARLRSGLAAALLSLFEVLGALLSGHWGHARDVVAAASWNTTHRSGIRRKRRQVARTRRVSDREVARLQVRGAGRALGFVRRQIQKGDDRLLADAGRPRRPGAVRPAALRTVMVVVSAVVAVLLVGSRTLLVDGVPALGTMQPLPAAASTFLEQFTSGWRSAGLGSEYPAPSAYGVLGASTALVLGAVGLLRNVLLLGMLPLGLLGAWHLTVPIGSRRARLCGVLVYGALPVGINALATGRWSGLAAYGLAPWLLSILARGAGIAPYGPRAADPDTDGTVLPLLPSLFRQVLSAGVVGALVGLLAPVGVLLPMAVATAFVVGGLLVGQGRGSLRLLAIGVGGSALAALLHLPAALGALDEPDRVTLLGSWLPAPGEASTAAILRFETGPHGASVLLYGILLGAMLGVVVGRRWRLSWAARGWVLALLSWAPVWFVARGDIPDGIPDPELLLAPGAAGIALAAAMGVAAFEIDLSDYRFGWRQAVSVGALAALVAGMLPVLGASASGTWDMPRRDFAADFAALDARAGEEPYRVVWLGADDVLPAASWPLDGIVVDAGRGDDRPLHVAVTDGAVPTAVDSWIAPAAGATDALLAVVGAGLTGGTSRIGSLLAPMGVRYVIVVDRPAPAPYLGAPVAPTPATTRALERQLDLQQLDLNPAVRVYENAVTGPVRGALPGATTLPSDPLARGGVPALEGAPLVLPDAARYPGAGGDLGDDVVVWVASGFSTRWELSVGGAAVEPAEAAGWATTFEVARGGAAQLRYETASSRMQLVLVQVALWVLVLVAAALLRSRHVHRERRHRDEVDRGRAAVAARLAAGGRDEPAVEER